MEFQEVFVTKRCSEYALTFTHTDVSVMFLES